VRIGIDANRRIVAGKKKDTDKSGIGIKITTQALAAARDIGSTGLEQDGAALCEALLTAYRGDSAAAWSILHRLDADRRPDWSVMQMRTWFLRIRGMVALLDGDAQAALADTRESIALDASGGNAATAFWQGVQAAARLGDRATIDELMTQTAGLRGPWVDSVRATAHAARAALTGEDVPAAASAMTEALAAWRDRRLPIDHACAAALARNVLPRELVPRADVDSALDYLHGLSAEGLLRLF
jgi:hypothetical protein